MKVETTFSKYLGPKARPTTDSRGKSVTLVNSMESMTGRREQRNGWTEAEGEQEKARAHSGRGGERGRPVLNGKKSKQRTFCGEERERRGGGGYSVGGVFATRADWLTEYRLGLDTTLRLR